MCVDKDPWFILPLCRLVVGGGLMKRVFWIIVIVVTIFCANAGAAAPGDEAMGPSLSLDRHGFTPIEAIMMR